MAAKLGLQNATYMTKAIPFMVLKIQQVPKGKKNTNLHNINNAENAASFGVAATPQTLKRAIGACKLLEYGRVQQEQIKSSCTTRTSTKKRARRSSGYTNLLSPNKGAINDASAGRRHPFLRHLLLLSHKVHAAFSCYV